MCDHDNLDNVSLDESVKNEILEKFPKSRVFPIDFGWDFTLGKDPLAPPYQGGFDHFST